MRGPLDVHRRLVADGIQHEIVHLTRRVSNALDLPESLGVPPEACAVVHVVFADDHPVAVVLPAGRTWSPAALARALGARTVRRADSGETSAATEYSYGLVSPVALPAAVPVLLDADVAAAPTVYAATGQTATAVTLRGRDLASTTRSRVGSISNPERAAPEVGQVFERFAASRA